MAATSSEASRVAAVLQYLREQPPRTARDIAIDVLGGRGSPRTWARNTAHRILRKLEDYGLAKRVPGAGEGFRSLPQRWTDTGGGPVGTPAVDDAWGVL